MIRLLVRALEIVSGLALLIAIATPLMNSNPVVSIGVWVASTAGWVLLAKLRPSDEPPRFAAMIPMILAAFMFQHYADRWIPMLGSAVILAVNVGGVVSELRQQRIPVAVIRSRK